MARNREIRIVIDRSGSMSSWDKKVVDGLNAYIGRVREDAAGKKAYIRIVQFDNMGTDILRQGIGAEIQDLKPEEFQPRALTPLYDNLASALTDNLEADTDYVVVIFTDGLENASKGEYRTAFALRQLVLRRQNEGVIILYLGANIDAWQQAEEVGIPSERAMNVHVQGTNIPPVETGWFGRKSGNGGSNVAKAFVAAAGLGLAYYLLKPGSAEASDLGFSETDRNEAMGVDGVTKTWQDAVQEDISGFTEPFPDMFSLPPDLQQEMATLPADFDPLKGSLNEDGTQLGGFDSDADVQTAEDHEALTSDDSGSDTSTPDRSESQDYGNSSSPPDRSSDNGWFSGGNDSSNDSVGGFDIGGD